MSLLERIRLRAREKDLTLAEIERILGFGNSTMRKWDQNSPSLDKIIKTANLLDVSISWLATGQSDSNDPAIQDLIKEFQKLDLQEQTKVKNYMEICNMQNSANVTPKQPACFKDAPASYKTTDTVAILGYVAAGTPIEGISIPLGYTESPVSADYVLVAKGHSMEPIIQDGDYIYVKNCSTLEPGEIGIFYINGDVTCKKFHMHQDCIILESLNPNFKPFKYRLNEWRDFKIQGKVLLSPEQEARYE